MIKKITANKKLLIRSLICFAVVIVIALSAVALKHFVSKPTSKLESTTMITETETVPVTDNSGEFVTDENGEQVFDKITVTKPQPVSTTEKQAFLDKLFNKNDSTTEQTGDFSPATEGSATTSPENENVDTTASSDTSSEGEGSTQSQQDFTKPDTDVDVDTTAPKESNGFTYTISNGSVKLLSYTGSDSVVRVPSEIDGKHVAYLGSNVFSNKSNITTIIFEGASSGSERFYLPANTTVFNALPNLTTVEFPFETSNYFVNSDGSTSYTYSFSTLFSGCPKISSVNFGAHINSMHSPSMSRMYSIDGVVFAKTSSEESLVWYPIAKSQTEYVIPENTRKIEKNAFFNNSFVEAITISSKITTIATPNFRSCSRLFSFSVAEGNSSFSAIDGVLYYPSFTSNSISFFNAFYPMAKTDISFTFPSDMAISFDANTFCGNPYLKEITISKNSRIDDAMLSSDSRPINLEKILASQTCLIPPSAESIYTIEYYD